MSDLILKLSSPAKINLALDVLKKTKTGFHEIQTIIQEVPDLQDEIEFLKGKKEDKVEIILSPKVEKISKQKKISKKGSILYKAILNLKKQYKIKDFIKIKIYKNIPFRAGLGGISSNTANILKGLNKIWDLNLKNQELMKIGAKLGKDIPFFIKGGTCLCSHFGEKVIQLEKNPIFYFKKRDEKQKYYLKILLKSSEDFKKTKNAYNSLNLVKCGGNKPLTKSLNEAIKSKNYKIIIKNIHNDFETINTVPKNKNFCGAGPSMFEIKGKF